MTTATAPDLEPNRSESKPERVFSPQLVDAKPLRPDPGYFDPTRGAEVDYDPYDDPTQGRKIGSDAYDDPTRGAALE